MIDLGDAEVGAVEYEWVALWFGLCGRDPDLFRGILLEYDPGHQFNEAFRHRMLAYTFIHRFGAQIIASILDVGEASNIRSLEAVQDRLWPSTLDQP